jgi:hypothetical protein
VLSPTRVSTLFFVADISIDWKPVINSFVFCCQIDEKITKLINHHYIK